MGGSAVPGRPRDMIKAAIVDADPKAAARLGRLLEKFPGLEVVGSADTPDAAERLIRDQRPDVVFLDPRTGAPGDPGVWSLVQPPARVVIVTADDSFAVAAFEHAAADYLLKPPSRDRLELTLRRLQETLAKEPARGPRSQRGPAEEAAARPVPDPRGSRGEDPVGGPGGGPLTISDKVALFRERGRTVELVPVADILWVEALQNYTRVQLAGGKPIVLKRTLADWQSLLPPEHFGRIGRSLIIQLARLRSTRWQSRDETLLVFEGTDATLPIGRSATARLKELFRGGEGR
ncbi:MAG: DNA-binding response regulator [Planctomycetia bacterium]|nr:DNA-binding response regulator [Planctomycetia bacterium]